MQWQEILGILGGFLGNFGIVPQIWRLFHYKTAYEISLPFLWMWLASIICWLLYGIFLGLFSVIMWNCITMVLAGLMMYAKLKWGIRAKQDKPA
jgi:MtN3 and saliva related transmembrane protein